MDATTTFAKSPDRHKRVLNRITRRWGIILPLWWVVGGLAMYLIYRFVEPHFEAFSMLQIEPVQRDLFEPAKEDMIEIKPVTPYLRTQAALITTDRVLGDAISHPEIVNLTTIKQFVDPKNDLRKLMSVEILQDAFLIRVALDLPDGNQAAAIVNAVVRSYLQYHNDFKRSRNSDLRASLVDQQGRLQKQVEAKQSELKALHQVNPSRALSLNISGKQSDPTQPTFGALDEDHSRQLIDAMVKSDLDLIKAQAMLEATQAASEGANDQQLRQALSAEKLNVAALLNEKDYLAKYFERLKIEKKAGNNDGCEATVVKYRLDVLLKREELVTANLLQLDFEAPQEVYRVQLVDPAAAPKAPTDNNRIKFMAAAPIAVLLMLLGFFLLLPISDDPVSVAAAGRPAQAEPAT